LPRNSEYTPRACYPYYSTAQRPRLSHKLIGKDWILFIYGTNDVSCTSAGTISCLTMRFCVVLACLTSPTSSANEDWVSLVTSPNFEVMHRQTRSSEFVPRRGMVTGLRRSGDAPAVVHPPPGSTRSAVTRVLQRRRPWRINRSGKRSQRRNASADRFASIDNDDVLHPRNLEGIFRATASNLATPFKMRAFGRSDGS